MEDLVAVLRKDAKRPSLDNVDAGLAPLITACWASDPNDRPTFEEICDRLNSVHVENVQALGRNRTLPVLTTKTSPVSKNNHKSFNFLIFFCSSLVVNQENSKL